MSYLLAARTTEIRKQRLRNSHSQQKQTKKGDSGAWASGPWTVVGRLISSSAEVAKAQRPQASPRGAGAEGGT